MKPIYISYYTKGTIYEEIMNTHLLPSLEKWKLKYHIYEIDSTGQWHTNARLKPRIIKKALEEFKEDIIWIDADATIEAYPKLFDKLSSDGLVDLATHWLSWETHYGRPDDVGKFEMLDGTVFFKNNEKMKAFIDRWIKEQGTNDHQKVLAKILESKTHDLNVYNYGREYCYIKNLPNGNEPVITLKEPIIVHYQASRNAKKSLYEVNLKYLGKKHIISPIYK